MTTEAFDAKYTYNEKIISNDFDNESQLGMLETFGTDYQQVCDIQKTNPKTIWAMRDCDEDDNSDGIKIIAGMPSKYSETPIYYVITEEEWEEQGETFIMSI